MSDSSIMSVREMIDMAFGESDMNLVNFKLIQAILYLLARQLRVLERRVGVEIGFTPETSGSSLSVTEVKMHAAVPKKHQKRNIPPPAKGSGQGIDILSKILSSTAKIISTKKDDHGSAKKGASKLKDEDDYKSDSGKTISKSDKRSTDKSSADKPSAKKSSSDKTYGEKAAVKKSDGKSSYDKEYDDKPSSDKKSSEKSSSYTKSTGKSSADKRDDDDEDNDAKSVSDKIHDDDKPFSKKKSAGKSSSDKRHREYDDDSASDKAYDDGRSTDKKSTRKSSLEKSSTGKSSSNKRYDGDDDEDHGSASDKTSDKRYDDDNGSASSEHLSQRSAAAHQKSTDKHSSKESVDKSKSDKPSTKKTNPDELSRGISVKGTSSNISGGSKRQKNYRLLELIEEERERVLRVIHQRADSHEENVSSPSPIASLESTEIKYEKLLIVERVPNEDAKGPGKRRSKTDDRGRTPRLSVVTQEQFAKLVKAVMDLEAKFGPIGVAGFPENVKLMEELRKGASLTDAMAALQLSARLEAAEKALARMTSLVTELASRTPNTGTGGMAGLGDKIGAERTVGTKGVAGDGGKAEREITHDKNIKDGESETRVLFDEPDTESQGGALSIKSGVSKKVGKGRGEGGIVGISTSPSDLSVSMMMSTAASERQDDDDLRTGDPSKKRNYVTFDQLDAAMQELYDDFTKTVNTLTTKSNANSDNAVKIVNRIETKIEETLNLGNRMHHLESAVAEYVEQINTLDTGLSSQMTNYQEQLTQMQHDLETGLENMAEALATQGGDTEAVTELNAHFTTLQYDFDRTKGMQKELDDVQHSLSLDLQDLWKEIELLRDTKSDRDEVADALRDKAGISVLNGMVTLFQFDAVRGDFEKRISNAYDKFNNQEVIWQKAIDDLLREINEKAEVTQVEALREDVNKNMEMLRGRVDSMLNVLGEPRSAALTRRLFRDTECLSCSTPAYMALEEPNLVPPLPAMPTRPPAVGEEGPSKATYAGDGDHGLCYPGLPITHTMDPRARFCTRYCGGAHTAVCTKSPRQQLINININHLVRETTAGVGTDGKTYMLDQQHVRRPCLPCNVQQKPTVAKTPFHEKVYKSFGGMSAATGDSGFSKPTVLSVALPSPPQDDDGSQQTAQAITSIGINATSYASG